ncbi:MAG: hypothetical protein GY786_08725 [Proteobacteria bacterium]|nr:hypothetical protein [Pseudomonadota bacterium]
MEYYFYTDRNIQFINAGSDEKLMNDKKEEVVEKDSELIKGVKKELYIAKFTLNEHSVDVSSNGESRYYLFSDIEKVHLKAVRRGLQRVAVEYRCYIFFKSGDWLNIQNLSLESRYAYDSKTQQALDDESDQEAFEEVSGESHSESAFKNEEIEEVDPGICYKNVPYIEWVNELHHKIVDLGLMKKIQFLSGDDVAIRPSLFSAIFLVVAYLVITFGTNDQSTNLAFIILAIFLAIDVQKHRVKDYDPTDLPKHFFPINQPS